MRAWLALVGLLLLLSGCGEEKAEPIKAVEVDWQDWDSIQADFPVADRPLFVYVDEYGCGYCEQMDTTIFNRPEIAAFLNDHFIPVRVDINMDMPALVQDSLLEEREFRRLLGIDGTPTYLFFDTTGNIAGYYKAAVGVRSFKQRLLFVHAGYFARHVNYADFLKSPEADVDTSWGVF